MEQTLQERISQLREQFRGDLKGVTTTQELEEVKLRYLSKKGPVQELIQALRVCTPQERPAFGKWINDLKEEIGSLCEQALEGFSKAELARRLAGEWVDVTLPGRRRLQGRRHPITLMFDEILSLFVGMGFSVQYGPDVESDYYNYEGLNFPKDHPARDMQDTFYLTSDLLLRSHTSNTQLRVMQSHAPPIRIVAPGTVFRNEDISSRSHLFFHQVEGLYVAKGVCFADLLATIREFCSKLFKGETHTRFRPSYFPFVEPGLEVDIQCTACRGEGCRLCKHSGWLEVMGAGMVHPEVLRNGGIDPEQYRGYAFGMGIERLTMLRYGIRDIRMFAENDLRFLAQF